MRRQGGQGGQRIKNECTFSKINQQKLVIDVLNTRLKVKQ